jgi:gliding-associated putative ABC transporter substrate-binding component GldG
MSARPVASVRRTLLWNASLQAALVVVIVVLANLVASRSFVRMDLSGDGLYGLHESTRALATKLDKPLVVKVYLTEGLQAPYGNHGRYVRDLLAELGAYARGRLRVEVLDPATDPELERQAVGFGVQPLDYSFREADRAELRRVWMGAVLLYGDRQEVLPSMTDLGTLEYDLAVALHRLQAPSAQPPVVGFTLGHGEPDLAKPEGPLRGMVEQIARRYPVRAVDLGGAGGIPEDVQALLIVGPQRPFTDRELYQVDQYLMRGGAAGFFLTNTRPDMKTLRTARVTGGLEPLVGHYGIKVGRDLVLDRVQNGTMRFPVRSGNAQAFREVSYPLLPRATDLAHDSVLVGGLSELLFPFAATLTLPDSLPPGVDAQVLARSSAASGAVTEVPSADPNELRKLLDGERRGPFPLLVALTGPLRSFYETRPVPAPEPDAAPTDPENAAEPARIAEGADTRLLVSGSADFVANNPDFVLNAVDWMVQDEALIGIRGRTAPQAPLAPTSAQAQTMWKVGAMLLGPGLLMIFGLVRAARRRLPARRSATPEGSA